MHCLVVGPGALGCLWAARLHLAGRVGVRLLDHDPRRAAFLQQQGIIFEELPPAASPATPLPIAVGTDPAVAAEADLVVLCVKSFALDQALAAVTPFLTPATLLLALPNGIAHLEKLAALAGRCRPAVGVSTEGATLLDPGRVRAGGHGLTRLGYAAPTPTPRPKTLTDPCDPLPRAAAEFSQAGLDCRLSDDIRRDLWHKLLVNAGINALSVIHDCPNGRLLEIPAARREMAQAVREAAAVARADGIDIADDPVMIVEEVCRRTATNISSMLQDRRRERPTEIMAINGEIVHRARQLGLNSPANDRLLRAIAEGQNGN